jgi:YidC/Oxa1 family membrane protein insertase
VLNFLYTAVSWVLLRWHDLFTAIGFSDSSGWGWALSIIFLVITARLLLVRLFIRQVHYTRNMQKIQPKIQKLREKYKDDRAEMNRQMMALQQEEGFNPLTGCLPMLLQIPVFIGLFHSLRHLSNSVSLCSNGVPKDKLSEKGQHLLSLYTFDKSETCHAATAKILNTPLAASFHDGSAKIHQLGGEVGSSRIVLIVLLLISAGATFATQLLVKANQTTVAEGTAATMQRLMLWIVPIGVLASGLLFNFPLGVLLYWFTSNLWTLGQQAYIIRYHPPTDEPEKPVGQLGKTLAPKVGQKPTRSPRSTADGPSMRGRPTDASSGDGTDGATADSGRTAATNTSNGADGAVRPSVPRPGQRPNRSKRPPAKRPTQSKKRR